MPKDTTSDFFTDDQPKQSVSTPDNASKWINVAEKGIGLLETLIAMRQKREGTNGGETSAYEKGLGQGQQMAIQQQPLPQAQIPSVATLNVKTGEAVEYLKEALGKINQDKTIKEYLEEDIKELEDSGMLNAIMEKFISEFAEVVQ